MGCWQLWWLNRSTKIRSDFLYIFSCSCFSLLGCFVHSLIRFDHLSVLTETMWKQYLCLWRPQDNMCFYSLTILCLKFVMKIGLYNAKICSIHIYCYYYLPFILNVGAIQHFFVLRCCKNEPNINFSFSITYRLFEHLHTP